MSISVCWSNMEVVFIVCPLSIVMIISDDLVLLLTSVFLRLPLEYLYIWSLLLCFMVAPFYHAISVLFSGFKRIRVCTLSIIDEAKDLIERHNHKGLSMLLWSLDS